MAGRNFNQAQEVAADGRNVITLSRHVRSAVQVMNESQQAVTSKKDPQLISDGLHGAARDILSVPRIDDRSEEIKQQVADLLTKRADAFAAAAKDQKALPRAVLAEWDSTESTFNAYFEWEDSVLSKYQLEKRR